MQSTIFTLCNQVWLNPVLHTCGKISVHHSFMMLAVELMKNDSVNSRFLKPFSNATI